MPKRKRVRRIRIRAGKGRKRRRTNNRTRGRAIIQPGKQLMPASLFVKLPYTEVRSISDSTALQYAWNGNNVFDPDRTGFGHQPRGYDQFEAFYTQYVVMACRIKVLVIQEDAAAQYFSLMAHNNTTVHSINDNMTEIANSTDWRYLNGASSNFPRRMTTFRMYRTTKAVLGKVNDEDYAAPTNGGGSPDRAWIYQLSNLNDTGTFPSTYNLTMSVVLTYYVKFFGRADIPES